MTALDGYQAVQAFVASNNVTPEIKATLTRLDKIRWERQLAEHGYERTRMSPELAEALRNEIRRALDNDGKPFDVVTARRVYDLAIAAKDMCAAASSNVQEAINLIADQNGPLESLTDSGTPESQAQASESFGARLIRELLAVVKPPKPLPLAGESPLDLVHALAEARRAGMSDVADELEKRLFGKQLSGDKPIAPMIEVEHGSFEHGFADGKVGALPAVETAEYKSGYLKGTEARYLDGVPVAANDAGSIEPLPPPPHGTVKLDDGPRCQEKNQCEDVDGSGTCFGCGRWLGGEREEVQTPHAFEPRTTKRFQGPVLETCEHCGKDPRNVIHDVEKPATPTLDEYQQKSTGGLSLDEAERIYKENLGY